ncbi:unnamed protein product [Cylicostephanus goldi]|uniref:Uncharacterized protein n=1 Tax=Cylicostephanus goldi TaxID=71465 RepID=A0A3P6QFW9_CYLGO|nr:unnamed protein product [Cylicostephanus goldi]
MKFVSVDHCFHEGYIDCVPRADVIFIRFESSPDDPWAIDQIDVDIHFRLGIGPENAYQWHFEHSVLLPCTSWLKDAAMYQIGPRIGLFVKHAYHYMPKENERIRDWHSADLEFSNKANYRLMFRDCVENPKILTSYCKTMALL